MLRPGRKNNIVIWKKKHCAPQINIVCFTKQKYCALEMKSVPCKKVYCALEKIYCDLGKKVLCSGKIYIVLCKKIYCALQKNFPSHLLCPSPPPSMSPPDLFMAPPNQS